MLLVVAVIALFIIIIILAIFFYLVKAEITHLSERLEFIRENDTNMQLYTGLNINALNKLVLQINKLISGYKSRSMASKQNEREFKQMLTNLSHDLRTPLTSVAGYIQMLKSQKTPETKKAEYIDIVERRVGSLRGMLDSLFEFVRLQSGDYEPDLQKADICSVLSDVVSMYYNDFTETGESPDISFEKDNIYVLADRNALRRIFENLISNSLKHGNGGLGIRVSSEGEYIKAEIKNIAHNLIDDDVQHLFNRFYTADKSRGGSNTGLGLAIVKELVNRMGGEVSAQLDDDLLIISILFEKLI